MTPSEPTVSAAPDRDPGAEISSIIGLDVEAKFRDGTTEHVKVLEVGFDLYGRYIAALDDEAACVELFCGKDKGWAARLTAASHNDLMQKGQGLNLPLLEAYLQRRKERSEMVNPGLGEKLQETMMQAAREQVQIMLKSALPDSSASSPAAIT